MVEMTEEQLKSQVAERYQALFGKREHPENPVDHSYISHARHSRQGFQNHRRNQHGLAPGARPIGRGHRARFSLQD